ncbi:hypothetical protein I6B53_01900 [Schaalia sp. 19OD2882]|uniref:DUF6507 family protein n=1 Tax=Schaalia sp. 19OD2882 TaxID=2794089 RepID=UPI001C1E9B00|nr:DUF6507 family protein [Schaalia sp. 19OD2882]QWW19902.1 hypothetical protein I6B53_01900 [Schaalia sp. 19OD2882]
MAFWKIDVPAARACVQEVADSVAQLEQSISLVELRGTEVAASVPRSELVAAAVQEWVEKCGCPSVSEVQARTQTIVDGTNAALDAYAEGQAAMSANALSLWPGSQEHEWASHAPLVPLTPSPDLTPPPSQHGQLL